MSKMMSQLLAYDNLTSLIQTNVNGIPVNILPQGFMTTTARFTGNQGRYNKVTGTQTTATIVNYGGPANVVNKWGMSTVPVTLLHAFEQISFDPQDLIALTAEDRPVLQQMGRQTVERNLANFAMRFQNLRLSAIMSALSLGAIYFDSGGNLLPTSSGASVTVDFSVPAAHKTQLNVTGGGSIIGASWATASTDIPGDIEAIQAHSVQSTGKPIRYAFYGVNIPAYLGANTNVGALIHASPALSEQMARSANAIPDGLLGLTWIPANRAFYVDSDGTAQSWFPADQVTFTPEPAADWWGFLEGSYIVPRSLELAADASQGLGDFAEVTGSFSFCAKSINPPGLTQFSGDTFLPVISNPDAVYIADVTP